MFGSNVRCSKARCCLTVVRELATKSGHRSKYTQSSLQLLTRSCWHPNDVDHSCMFRIGTGHSVHGGKFADSVSGQKGPRRLFDASIAISSICAVQLVTFPAISTREQRTHGQLSSLKIRSCQCQLLSGWEIQYCFCCALRQVLVM